VIDFKILFKRKIEILGFNIILVISKTGFKSTQKPVGNAIIIICLFENKYV